MIQHDGAYMGNLQSVKQLVTAANVEERDMYGCSVLHLACKEGHSDVATWLVNIGANVNARDSHGWTPLHQAASNSHPRCVQLLRDAGADASVANSLGSIPLHLARHSAECTALLIAAHPADVHAVDVNGSTPLHLAAHFGTVDVCALLLSAGSVIDAMNMFGRTPLHWALFNNTKRDVAELLLDRGARLELVKLDGPLKAIPDWAVSFVARRNACRSSCWAVLQLARRRSKVVKGNGRDALRLVAKCAWALRND